MREFNKTQIKMSSLELKSITCNCCGKDMNSEDGIEHDLFHNILLTFGYGSSFDTQRWQFDTCEDCVVKFVNSFKIKPTVSNYM